MLSRSVPQPNPQKREHLIVELKRPTVSVDGTVLQQVKDYAFAIRSDERFRDTGTQWVFWAISNEWSDQVRDEALAQDGPPGRVLNVTKGDPYSIWVKNWAQIIGECEGRMRFLREHLKYSADQDSALAYLRAVHAKYLPAPVQAEDVD